MNKVFGNIAMNIVTGYNKGQNIDKCKANKKVKKKREAGGGQRQERPAAERKKTRKTLL